MNILTFVLYLKLIRFSRCKNWYYEIYVRQVGVVRCLKFSFLGFISFSFNKIFHLLMDLTSISSFLNIIRYFYR